MRKLCVILFLFFLTKTSFSQINIGIRVGGNIATTKNLIAFPKNRLGWFAGFTTYIPISKTFYIEPELIFSSKGYRYIDLSDGETVAMRLNYLNIPILLRDSIDRKTNIVGGVELGYFIKAINNFNNTNVDATSSFPKRYDVGLAVGIQYDIIKQFGAEARYTYGIKEFYQTDAAGIRRSELSAANRVFQLGFNYHL